MPTHEATVADRTTDRATRVRVPKTAELVAAALRKRIVRGELREGDALPTEAILMEQFGVSRPTLREAFRILESESLLTVRRGARGGARIHMPDEEGAARYAALVLEYRGTDLADVRAACNAIETSCVSILAARRHPTDLEALQSALRDGEAAAEDQTAFSRAAEEFHRAIVTSAANSTLSLLWEMLRHMLTVTAADEPPPRQKPPAAGSEAKQAAARRHVDARSAVPEAGRAGATTVVDTVVGATTAGTGGPSGAEDGSGLRILRAHRLGLDLIRRGEGEAAVRHWAEHLRGGDGDTTAPSNAALAMHG